MDRHRFFRNLVIAVAGDFGHARTYANIRNHIEAAGGVFAGGRYVRATHIVASEEFAPRLIAQGRAFFSDPQLFIITSTTLSYSVSNALQMSHLISIQYRLNNIFPSD